MSQLFSLAEVAEQNGENGKQCWIIIRDIVYNVTDYLDDVSDATHPYSHASSDTKEQQP